MGELSKLTPGTLLRHNDRLLLYSGKNQETHTPVFELNPDMQHAEGVLHTELPLARLTKEATRIKPFGEFYSFSAYRAETAAWKAINPDLNIPYPPAHMEDILRTANEAGIPSLIPHFLPDIDLKQKRFIIDGKNIRYPASWTPMDTFIFQGIENTWFDADYLHAGPRWVLTDTTEFDGNLYKHDQLKPIIANLKSRHDNTFTGLRTYLSFPVVKTIVLPEIADILKISHIPQNEKPFIQVPSAAEYNILGNMYFRKWNDHKGFEWLRNPVRGKVHSLIVGDPNAHNSLANYSFGERDKPDINIGFRLIVLFPPVVPSGT